MGKGWNRSFFGIIFTVLGIGILVFVLQWMFKIGNAQFSGLSDVFVCEKIILPSGVSYEEVATIITDTVPQLYLCGFLETDGRPARLLVTVRDSNEALVYDQYGEYVPGNVQFPFEIPIENKDTYTVYVTKGRSILAENQITVASP